MRIIRNFQVKAGLTCTTSVIFRSVEEAMGVFLAPLRSLTSDDETNISRTTRKYR